MESCRCLPIHVRQVPYAEDQLSELLTITRYIARGSDFFFQSNLSSPSGAESMSLPAPRSHSESEAQPSTNVHTDPFRRESADSAQSSPGGRSTSSPYSLSFDDTVIPSSHARRTLVLCFDGTGDQFDADVCAFPHDISHYILLTTRDL